MASPLSFGMAAASRERTLGCSTLENAQSWCTWPVPAPWLLNPSTVLRHKDTAPQGTPLRCDPFPIPPCCILPPRFITASISGPACYKRDDPDNTRGQAWAARAEEEKCEAKSFPGKLEGAESGPRGSGMRAERDLPSQPHLTRQNHGPETGGTCRDVFIEGTKSTVATSGQPDRRVWFGGRHRWPQDGSGRELFGRKLCPSLAGAAAWLGWPSAHAASPQLGVMPAPGDATRVGGMRDRHPRNATGAGNHRSSWRGAWWVVMGRAPAGEQGWVSCPKHTAGKAGESETGAGPHPLREGCVRSIPAPALSCQAAREQPSWGRPLQFQPQHGCAHHAAWLRGRRSMQHPIPRAPRAS